LGEERLDSEEKDPTDAHRSSFEYCSAAEKALCCLQFSQAFSEVMNLTGNFHFGRGQRMTRSAFVCVSLFTLALLILALSPGWGQTREVSLRQLRDAVKTTPKDPRLHYLLGLKYQHQGKERHAREAYQKAISLNPRYTPALLRLGALKSSQGDQGGAVQALTKALRLDPKNQEARDLLGVVYGRQGLALLKQGNAAAAARVLKKAAANNPKDDAALNNLGVALAAQGDLDQAAQAFQLAIQANPANDNAHFNLGFIYLQRGNKTGALNQYAALTTLESGYGGELFALMSYPKGYPVDTPYSPPQWGQSTPYKALPAGELPPPPDLAGELQKNPGLQIPSYGSELPKGQKQADTLGQTPGLQVPAYKSSLPKGELPGPAAPMQGKE
jgi:Flp pilus assembly protein TadD